MTQFVSLSDAQMRLSALVDRAAAGEAIVITKNGIPAARLVPIEQAVKHRRPANAMGIEYAAADFDAPDPSVELVFGDNTAPGSR